jgi:hypothetical protein
MGHGFCVFIVEMKTDVAGPSEMLVTTLTYNPENHNTYLLWFAEHQILWHFNTAVSICKQITILKIRNHAPASHFLNVI